MERRSCTSYFTPSCFIKWIPHPPVVPPAVPIVGPVLTLSTDTGQPSGTYIIQVPHDFLYLDVTLVGGGGAGAPNSGPALGAGGGGSSGQGIQSTTKIHLQPGSSIVLTLGAGSTSSSPGEKSTLTYIPFGGGSVTVTADGGVSGSINSGNNGGVGGSGQAAVNPGFNSAYAGGGGGGAGIADISHPLYIGDLIQLSFGFSGPGGLGQTMTVADSGQNGRDALLVVFLNGNILTVASAVAGKGGNGGAAPTSESGGVGGSVTVGKITFPVSELNAVLGPLGVPRIIFPLFVLNYQIIAGGGGGGASIVSPGGAGGSGTSLPVPGKNGSGGGGASGAGDTLDYTPGGNGYAQFQFFSVA